MLINCCFPDGKVHGFGIEFAEFPEKHTGRNIADKVIHAIQEYGLKGKITGIVVDNASNNDAAMKIITQHLGLNDSTFPNEEELHFRCFGHAKNLGCKGKLEI